MELIIVTGLSGSGKSIALRVLEDSGFYCIDNLPATLLPQISHHLDATNQHKVAISIDSRSAALETLPNAIEMLKNSGISVRVLFLESSVEIPVSYTHLDVYKRQHKYMLTPRGVYELKYFFGSHVATDAGGECSATAIRALIKQMVAEENVKKPLSDSQFSEILAKQGIVVARRTIAKYRESLNIPPANLRKSL